MLDKADKTWISENFATKDEFNELKGSMVKLKDTVDDVMIETKVLKTTVERIEDGIDRVEELARRTLTAVENVGGRVAVLDQENKMGSITTARHTRQIEELAEKTNVTLSE